MICATENSAVVEAPIYKEWLQKMQDKGAYLVPKKDYKKIEDFVFNDNHGVNGPVAGMPATWICEQAGVKLPEGKDVLLFELDKQNIGEKLSSEKLSPLLSVYKAKDREEGIEIVEALLDYQGAGHNAGIQIGSQADPFVATYGDAVKASRVLVNQPDSVGGIGDVYTDALKASLTLGTGSWGKNSLSHNLSTGDLLNIKTVAKRRNRPQWIRLPEKTYYEKNAISYLQDEYEPMQRALIVADPGMVQFGFVDTVLAQLALRDEKVATSIYGTIKPDPTLGQTIEIAKQMRDFKPDTVIAIGGGSAIDASKIARLIYEVYLDRGDEFLDSYDAVSEFFLELQQKFIDIRKRIVKFKHQTTTRLFCIPTTSGTGAEVTPFAVITDDYTHVKYPLADYELVPQVAIVDPEFVMTVPKRTAAWSSHYLYGGSISLGWKGISFSLLFNGVGKQLSRLTESMIRPMQGQWLPAPSVLLNDNGDRNYWSVYNTAEQNASVRYPRLSHQGGEYNNYKMSDFWLRSSAYMRIKNINIGYTVPKKIVSKVGIKGLRVYVNIDDPYCFDSYLSGWDPEAGASTYITRTYTFGVDWLM